VAWDREKEWNEQKGVVLRLAFIAAGKLVFGGAGLALFILTISIFRDEERAQFLHFLAALVFGVLSAVGVFNGVRAFFLLRNEFLSRTSE
jgi:uncharacterized membrane protein YqjE